MATEPEADTDRQALAAELDTENIAFVDSLNDEIADVIENTDTPRLRLRLRRHLEIVSNAISLFSLRRDFF